MTDMPTNRIRILSIDDEPAMLKTLSKALTSRGYDLEICNKPEEGLQQLIARDDIDLVLLDVRMPGRSGFDIYRDLIKHKKIPVLFVTAFPKSFNSGNEAVTEIWNQGFADGTTDIIYKPFDLKTLFEKVEGLVGKGSINE